MEKWYPPAISDLILQIDPTQTSIASVLHEHGYLRRYIKHRAGRVRTTHLSFDRVPFIWAYLHASEEDLENEKILDELARSIAAVESVLGTQAICVALLRRLESSIRPVLDESVAVYTCTIWAKALKQIHDAQIRSIHIQAAFEAPCIQSLLHASRVSEETSKGTWVLYLFTWAEFLTNQHEAISYFVRSFLDPSDKANRLIARDACEYWVSMIQSDNHIPPVRENLFPARYLLITRL